MGTCTPTISTFANIIHHTDALRHSIVQIHTKKIPKFVNCSMSTPYLLHHYLILQNRSHNFKSKTKKMIISITEITLSDPLFSPDLEDDPEFFSLTC